MAQSKSGVALALTHSLEKARARYPWARGWVQVKGGIWCFEDEREARTYQPEAFHEFIVRREPRKPKRSQKRTQKR